MNHRKVWSPRERERDLLCLQKEFYKKFNKTPSHDTQLGTGLARTGTNTGTPKRNYVGLMRSLLFVEFFRTDKLVGMPPRKRKAAETSAPVVVELSSDDEPAAELRGSVQASGRGSCGIGGGTGMSTLPIGAQQSALAGRAAVLSRAPPGAACPECVTRHFRVSSQMMLTLSRCFYHGGSNFANTVLALAPPGHCDKHLPRREHACGAVRALPPTHKR